MYLGLHTTEAPIGKPMNVVIQRDGKSSTVAITAIDIEQAGRQDDVSALRYLGDFHANLRGGDASNADKARRYYTRAAQLGDERAAARLAESYSGGTESDKAEARKWFEKAVAAGHAPSMLRLAAMYHDGVGGPKDPARARVVLEKGAAGGDITLMYELVRLCQEEGAGRMPEMRTWLEKIVATPKSAIPKDGGTTVDQATFDLAVAKLDGIGGPKDGTEGRRLMEKAAASGHAKRAPLLLGMLLMSGKGGPQDLVKARQWIERGTKGENADPDAMLALGRIYKDGVGVSKNPAEARKWFKKAADFGQSDAIKELGPQPKTVVATPAAPKGPVKPIPVDASLRGSFMTPRQAGPKCTPSCQDWAIIGDDLLPEASKAADADACRSLCTAAEKCVGWNFIARNGRCELKKTAVQFGLWQGEVTGIERPQLIPGLQPLAKPASAPGAGAPAPSSR